MANVLYHFPARAGHGAQKVPHLLFGGITCFLLAIAWISAQFRPIAVPLGTVLPVWLTFWLRGSPRWTRYQIRPDGLFVGRYFYRTLIPYGEIRSVDIQSGPEVLAELRAKTPSESPSPLQLRRALNATLRYSSVPQSYRHAHSRVTGLHLAGDFVKLELMNGKTLHLSPLDCDGLMGQVREMMTTVG
ncbi:MAG: hypothetical protein AB7P04_10565 [Bacteriovoracia bacterium]